MRKAEACLDDYLLHICLAGVTQVTCLVLTSHDTQQNLSHFKQFGLQICHLFFYLFVLLHDSLHLTRLLLLPLHLLLPEKKSEGY